jgi:two-component system, response regulator
MINEAIMLVEDNPDDAELMLRALRKNQIHNEVYVVKNGAEALTRLRSEASVLPTLVVLDLNLPGIDGHEVLRQIRGHERTQLLPVIILTTSADKKDLLTSYRNGANSYVRKPVDSNLFDAAVRQISQYWLGLNEPPPIH